MHDDPIIVVGPEGAAFASFLPIRTEHEMLDDELPVSGKELRQALLPVRPLENVLLVDADPGQIASLRAQLIAQPGEFLFLRQVLLARLDPFVPRDDLMALPARPPSRTRVTLQ